MSLIRNLAAVTGALSLLPTALAGFDVGSKTNIAVYWGQNSFGQSDGPNVQKRLAYYCQNSDIDIIPIAFLDGLSPPHLNFANAGDNCTTFADSPGLLDCPQIEEDITACQDLGKTIVLSLAGATYSGGGFASPDAAVSVAQDLWARFGPEQSGSGVDRPFGSAVIDGFDYDFESAASNLAPFGIELRRLMDEAHEGGGKKFYLAAAPQCPYPDAANGQALDAVPFDFLMIQYYNNYCGINSYVPGAAEQFNFNFETWDNWAKKTSKNPNVKIMLGVPAAPGAGAGYTEGDALAGGIKYAMQFPSFGGVMMWDMSQLYANSGFLGQVTAALGKSAQ